MDRKRVHFAFFLLTFAFFGLISLNLIMPFLIPILWAIVIGTVIMPLQGLLCRICKRRWLASLITTTLVVLFMVIPALVVSVLVIDQALDISRFLVRYFQEHSYRDLINTLRDLPLIRDHVKTLDPVLDFLQSKELRGFLANSLNNIMGFLGDRLGQMAFSAGRNIFYIFVFVLTLFFVLRDGPSLVDRLKRAIPLEEDVVEDLFSSIYRTILAVVYGSVGTAFVQAVLAYIAYSIVGISYALLWSLATFFAAFIPPFGASAVWFPLAVYTFFTDDLWKALFLGIWGMTLISTVDNFIRPLIIKQGVEVPYVILFFATIGGLLKFGFIGLFLGPIIFSILLTLFKVYERRVSVIGDQG